MLDQQLFKHRVSHGADLDVKSVEILFPVRPAELLDADAGGALQGLKQDAG